MHYKARILRIIDANINRAKEGLRVCEDIMRLALEDKIKTVKLKNLRHKISMIIMDSKIGGLSLQDYRNSQSDVGKKIKNKTSKRNIGDIFIANSQRVKEAMRVLEELLSIFDNDTSRKFGNLRFEFYDVEKECFKKIRHLCDIRQTNLS